MLEAMTYDLKIRDATIVDGTGAPAYRGDIGIAGGRIVALGGAPGAARESIDAGGLVAAPGFIDIHTHYDAQVMWDSTLAISPWHGVTTAVMGNCGFGIAPTRAAHRDMILRTLERVEAMSLASLRAGLGEDWGFETFPEYLDAVEARGTQINIGCYLGHTPLRLYVMGADAVRREATEAELAAMCRLVREGMEAGALGFSTTRFTGHNGFDGEPVPSRLASLAELDALVGTMAEAGHGIMQTTAGDLLLDGLEDLARAHGVTIAWSALLSGMRGPGSHRDYLEHIRRLIEDEGLNIVPQTSPRPLCIDFTFDEPFPFERQALFVPTMKTDREGRKAIYRDPAFRAAFKEDERGAAAAVVGWAGRTVISHSPSQPEITERLVADVARERGVHPVDLVLDLSLDSDFGARFRFATLNDDETAVGEILRDRHAVIALSDAGAHNSQLCDACYTTDLLGRWVREKGVLSLEEGVRSLTERPAEVLGLDDRGRLKEGLAADIVLFDPETVGASELRRVHDLPAGADRLISDASGIAAVFVNGTLIRRDGADALPAGAPLPGRLLRGHATRAGPGA